MTQTTFEEAKRCPQCNQPGEDRKTIAAPPDLPRGTTVHFIYCGTKLCPWYNTPWLVQLNPDNTVPPKTDHTHSKKVYVGFEHDNELAAQVAEALELQRQLSMRPDHHGEIKGPRYN